MKSEVSIAPYFDGLEEIFNPYIVYEGNYAFRAEALLSASKIVDGKNLFREYLEKKYYSNIRSILSKLNFTGDPHLFFYSENDGSYGRCLKMSANLFLTEMTFNITGFCPDLSEDLDEMKTQLVNYLRSYRKTVNEIKNGVVSVENRDVSEILLRNYAINEENRKKVYARAYRPLSYEAFLGIIYDYITSYIIGLRQLIPLLEKKIDLKELKSCFDLDKFYLVIAKQLIEISKISLNENGKIHNSFVFVEKYIGLVKALREQKGYDLKIKTYLMDGKEIKYSLGDIIKEYTQIKFEHPEFVVYEFENDGRDYRDMGLATEFSNMVKDFVDSKKLAASWNFVRNGQVDKTQEVPLEVRERLEEKKETKSKRTLSREEKIQNVTDRMQYLDHTNYVYKMMGKDNFRGYVGYIYDNGIVLFEKFYQDSETKEPSVSNATYVMTFNNFVEMSKKTKTDIMSYIKDGGTDVRRVYHTSNWINKIEAIIKGKTYDEKAMDKINNLISDGELNRVVKK